MGRRKIEIQPITHERNRSVTFIKRKNGLFKKAYELGVLCSVDVAVIIFEERPGHHLKLYQYCSNNNIEDIVARQIRFDGEKDTRGPGDFNGSSKNDGNINDDDDDDDGDDDMGNAPKAKKASTSMASAGLINGDKMKSDPRLGLRRPSEDDLDHGSMDVDSYRRTMAIPPPPTMHPSLTPLGAGSSNLLPTSNDRHTQMNKRPRLDSYSDSYPRPSYSSSQPPTPREYSYPYGPASSSQSRNELLSSFDFPSSNGVPALRPARYPSSTSMPPMRYPPTPAPPVGPEVLAAFFHADERQRQQTQVQSAGGNGEFDLPWPMHDHHQSSGNTLANHSTSSGEGGSAAGSAGGGGGSGDTTWLDFLSGNNGSAQDSPGLVGRIPSVGGWERDLFQSGLPPAVRRSSPHSPGGASSASARAISPASIAAASMRGIRTSSQRSIGPDAAAVKLESMGMDIGMKRPPTSSVGLKAKK